MRTPILSVDNCDPKRLIRDALEDDSGWSPKDRYLAWLLNLPVEIDAAHAAALLLERTLTPCAGNRAAHDLLALLRTTTAYPRERLDPVEADRRHLH